MRAAASAGTGTLVGRLGVPSPAATEAEAVSVGRLLGAIGVRFYSCGWGLRLHCRVYLFLVGQAQPVLRLIGSHYVPSLPVSRCLKTTTAYR